jgi:GDP-4-dehydro-6-deoxy-D-mannose reductase
MEATRHGSVMRALVTGIGGFVGPYLTRALLESGHAVSGVVRRPGASRHLADLHQEFPERFPPESVLVADLLDPRAVRSAVAAAQPDALFHLAGMSFVPAAEADPLAAYRTNFFGTLNVLRAVREAQPACRVVCVGSGEAYGAAGNEVAVLTEDVPLRPVNAYAVSKAAADLAAFEWSWSGGDVIRARPFNHTGAGQRPDFVCSDFARQVARIEQGLQPPILEVGNLDVERDFTDVRDIVEGYLALWERGTAGEAYNLCSGRGTRIGTVVEELCRRASCAIEVRVAAGRRRGRDIRRLVGSFARAEAHAGWRPRRPFAGALDELLTHWRQRVSAAR